MKCCVLEYYGKITVKLLLNIIGFLKRFVSYYGAMEHANWRIIITIELRLLIYSRQLWFLRRLVA